MTSNCYTPIEYDRLGVKVLIYQYSDVSIKGNDLVDETGDLKDILGPDFVWIMSSV